MEGRTRNRLMKCGCLLSKVRWSDLKVTCYTIIASEKGQEIERGEEQAREAQL